MLSALSPRPNQGNEASPAKGGGDRKHGAEASEERAAEATAAAGSGVKSDGGGGGDGAPDDAGLFVEELRVRIKANCCLPYASVTVGDTRTSVSRVFSRAGAETFVLLSAFPSLFVFLFSFSYVCISWQTRVPRRK